MRWRSTARRSNARCAPAMPAMRSMPASRSPIAPQRVADGLLDTSFFSGWGVRTVARGESRYNPMSYHNGSIWPHDNALIAHGFGRYGFKDGVAADLRIAGARRELYGGAPHSRALLRLSPAARARSDALSRRLLAAGLGGERALPVDPDDARPRIRPQGAANSPRQSRSCRYSPARSSFAISRSARRAST